MPEFQKAGSDNPKGRPIAARGLRAALVSRYGDGGLLPVGKAVGTVEHVLS